MLTLVAFGVLVPTSLSLDALLDPVNYTARQASSYDRASVNPSTEWFANADYGKYIRDEVNGGRNEHVMAELTGPGEVNRIWSANPQGTIRFYFDGEAAPRIELPMRDLLTKPTIGGLVGYDAARGCNVYGSIPYSKSLKVTLDEGGNWKAVYYHIGYRTYTDGRAMETFSAAGASPAAGVISNPAGATAAEMPVRSAWVTSGQPIEFTATRNASKKGVGVVRDFSLKVNKSELTPTWLRDTLLEVYVDGERTVVSPLGDFFSCAAGFVPYDSEPMAAKPDGTLVCRFPMPFKSEISYRLRTRHSGRARVEFAYSQGERPQGSPYRFRAQWSFDSRQTRPMYDMQYLNATGEGRLVGVSQHIENPVPGWWGEGDEKIYIDGETFPSFFGTGTEDFLGYAWSNPQLYVRPYHGQQKCDGPGTFGHSTQYRWLIADSVPFRKSMKLDMEMWHWIDCFTTCERVVYWYAKPGGTGNHNIPHRNLAKMVHVPNAVKGAIEGEKMKVLSATGGKPQPQGGFDQLSGGEQLWWVDVKPGDVLRVSIPIATPGRYRLVGNFGNARDYGKHRLKLDGKDLGEHEFYSPDLKWVKKDLGIVEVSGKEAILEVTCTGINPAAVPAGMFGLDYLVLQPVR